MDSSKLAQLCDIFDNLNDLNLLLQGPEKPRFDISSAIIVQQIRSCGGK